MDFTGHRSIIAVAVVLGGLGCAGWDNPTALSELDTETEFEFSVAEFETFEEVEVEVHVRSGAMRLRMLDARMEIEAEGSGTTREIVLTPSEHGDEAWEAHVTFYEPGEHHIHLFGRPERHRMQAEMGDREIEVERHHVDIGPYRVELAVSPAPVFEGGEGHIHLYVFEILGDGSKGAEVTGLDLGAEVHAPDGTESALDIVEEEAGEYEAEFVFGEHGLYEIHVEIDVDGTPEDGELHLPVLDPNAAEAEPAEPGQGGHGHG